MDGWKQCFFLLLPLCADTRVTVVKTIGSEPVIMPVCANENLSVIVVVRCQVSTGRHQEEECNLLYPLNKKFNHECDSRFTLMTENQTVFFHLTSLTPVDSGNYSCECSYERGTDVARLDITVEADKEGGTFGLKFIATAVITVTVSTTFIMAAVIICGPILRRINHRENTGSGGSELTRTETPCFLEEEPYTSLQRPASDVYQSISSSRPHCGNEGDFLPVYSVYETI